MMACRFLQNPWRRITRRLVTSSALATAAWTTIAGSLAVLPCVTPTALGAQRAPAATATASAGALQIYFIDVEGGQSTLMRLPSGESFLVDGGFPGDGTFASKPGAPTAARDAQRVLAAAKDAGITRIDHLLLTHYHADHFGAVLELAQLLPIGEFIDHAAPTPEAEAGVPGTMALYEQYVALRSKGKHVSPKPGDQLTFGGVTVHVLATEGQVASPLAGAGQTNAACTGSGVPAQEKTENPRSTAVLLQFGQFRFLDVGDLTGDPLFALGCPVNRIGRADVYLVAHHGGADAADPSLFAAIQPRVAITNNGTRKGAQAPTLATLRTLSGTDTWQLHTTANPGATNVDASRIANLDESTSAWIKVTAQANGGFRVTNGRTGSTTVYPAR